MAVRLLPTVAVIRLRMNGTELVFMVFVICVDVLRLEQAHWWPALLHLSGGPGSPINATVTFLKNSSVTWWASIGVGGICWLMAWHKLE